MLLFQKRFHAGLLSGEVRLTFRRWEKPHVRPGGRYRCHPIGVLEVEAVERVKVADISEADAQLCGFASKAELVDYMGQAASGPVENGTLVFRIALHHGGDGDRVEVALSDQLSAADVLAIRERLERLDTTGEAGGPWTRETLALIDQHPRVAASQLAARLGRETAPFKVDVRKLKKLGLTQSFEVGYEISPRGRAYLVAAAPRPRRKRGKAPVTTR